MGPVVFYTFLRKCPHAGVQVQLRPQHAGDFVSALPGQDQQPDPWPKGISHLPSGDPESPQLVVVENPIARGLGGRSPDAVTWRRFDNATLQAPIEKLSHQREYPICQCGAPAINNFIKHRDHISSPNTNRLALCPPWVYLTNKKSFQHLGAFQLARVPSQKYLGSVFHCFPDLRLPRRSALCTRVNTEPDVRQHLLGLRPRLIRRDGAMGADLELSGGALPAAHPVLDPVGSDIARRDPQPESLEDRIPNPDIGCSRLELVQKRFCDLGLHQVPTGYTEPRRNHIMSKRCALRNHGGTTVRGTTAEPPWRKYPPTSSTTVQDGIGQPIDLYGIIQSSQNLYNVQP